MCIKYQYCVRRRTYAGAAVAHPSLINNEEAP
jgi:hypothetical protein